MSTYVVETLYLHVIPIIINYDINSLATVPFPTFIVSSSMRFRDPYHQTIKTITLIIIIVHDNRRRLINMYKSLISISISNSNIVIIR